MATGCVNSVSSSLTVRDGLMNSNEWKSNLKKLSVCHEQHVSDADRVDQIDGGVEDRRMQVFVPADGEDPADDRLKNGSR